MDLEQRTAPPNCTNGWQNETWVARTFWDLHDTRGDGSDVLWFNHLGAVPALYLANGVASNGDATNPNTVWFNRPGEFYGTCT